MSRWALRIGVVALGLLGSMPARAEERARGQGLATFEWTQAPGAEGCLSGPEIIEDVERSLKRRVFTTGPADRVLRAAIAPAPSGWHATIDLSTHRGVALGAREIDHEGTDCREASGALVLAISLMADLPELPAERRPPPAPPPPPPVRFRAAAAPAVVVDDRPEVQPGANIGLEIAPRAFVPIVVDLMFQMRAGGDTREQSYWLLGGTFGASLCPLRIASSRLGILGCAGPEMTLYAARGRGFSSDQTALSSTFGGLVQARASYAFTDRLHAFVFVCGIATPQRVALFFGIDQVGKHVLDRTAYVTGIAGLGVILEL